MKKIVVLLACIAQFVSCSSSDPTTGVVFDVPNALKGKVVDDKGNAVANSSVEILSVTVSPKGDSSYVLYNAKSDDKGEFAIDNYESGLYTLYSHGENLSYLDSKRLLNLDENAVFVLEVSNNIDIQGRVISNGVSVKVSLVGANQTVEPDADGFYSFSSIPKGVYEIAFISNGERVDYLSLNTKETEKSVVYVKDVKIDNENSEKFNQYGTSLPSYSTSVEVYEEGSEPDWYDGKDFEPIYYTITDGEAFYNYYGTGFATEVSGFATVQGKGVATTVGADFVNCVVVKNREELITACSSEGDVMILVEGVINLNYEKIDVSSNKTIIGKDAESGLRYGGLRLINASNIEVKNLKIFESADDDKWNDVDNNIDGITVENSHHVWIDHCTFSKIGDGAVDIVKLSSYVTLSNNLFEKSANVILVGNNDEEIVTEDDYNVTIFNNHFKGTLQGHARARYGKLHIYNNFYDSLSSYNKSLGISGDGYGIGIGVDVKILSENNLFDGVIKCSKDYDKTDQNGILVDHGSLLINGSKQFEQDSVAIWDASSFYEYSLIDPVDIPATLEESVGSGHYYIK